MEVFESCHGWWLRFRGCTLPQFGPVFGSRAAGHSSRQGYAARTFKLQHESRRVIRDGSDSADGVKVIRTRPVAGSCGNGKRDTGRPKRAARRRGPCWRCSFLQRQPRLPLLRDLRAVPGPPRRGRGATLSAVGARWAGGARLAGSSRSIAVRLTGPMLARFAKRAWLSALTAWAMKCITARRVFHPAGHHQVGDHREVLPPYHAHRGLFLHQVVDAVVPEHAHAHVPGREHALGLRAVAPEHQFVAYSVERRERARQVEGIQLSRRHPVREQGGFERAGAGCTVKARRPESDGYPEGPPSIPVPAGETPLRCRRARARTESRRRRGRRRTRGRSGFGR